MPIPSRYPNDITKKLKIRDKELSNFKLSNKKREMLDNESHEFINRIFFTLNEITKETNDDSNEPKTNANKRKNSKHCQG